MSNSLKVRTINFEFPDDMLWNWNPGRPQWGNFGHFISFMAPGFERYFIRSIRKCIPQIQDAALAEEAELFCRQEGLHAKHHYAHISMLARKYPGLASVREDITRLYDDLFEQEPLSFHLAYAAVVEATFSPFTKFVVENRQHLFKDTDPRMASFIMWHMMEEYEHRSSALNIYNAVVGSYWYRIRMAPRVVTHLSKAIKIIEHGITANVPTEEMGWPIASAEGLLEGIPRSSTLALFWNLACTLLPMHNPDNIEQPDWVGDWFEAENNGVDMRTYYPLVAR